MSDATHSPLTPKFGAIILAAGSSSRLGQPKQLLVYKGRPLIVRAAEAALAAGASPVVIVLGAHAEKIRRELHALRAFPLEGGASSPPKTSQTSQVFHGCGADEAAPSIGSKLIPNNASAVLHLVENPAWAEGMGSSIRTGLTALETAAPSLDAALIAVCDHPHFSAAAIDKLRAALTGGFTIAATRHADGAGVPAIFARIHFSKLRALTGASGARRIIASHAATTAAVDLPELALDIDTPDDWARLPK